ncbi:MAG: hypothetical protein JXA95_08555 [Spirochaetales bacterium]|nr:hypothetical protein [Spirochaetales bacterium]
MEAVRNKKYMRMGILLLTVLLASCPVPPPGEGKSLIDSVVYVDNNEKSTDWTVFYYADADNNLESALLGDIYELSQGMESTDIVNVIALFDRAPDYSVDSTILGANFTDTRLYRVGADEIYPLDGKEFFDDIGLAETAEYNMGDANTLKSFIEYGKKYYPANHYVLILSNHGSGVRSYPGTDTASDSKGGTGLASSETISTKAISYDDTSDGDAIYTAELTDILDSRHSVDLIVYDACLMGLLEIGYQYRPVSAGGDAGEFSADYMAASVPNVWNAGLPYDRIFARISRIPVDTGEDSTVTGGTENMLTYAPGSLTPEILGTIMVEEQKISTNSRSDQSFALYDLSEVGTVVDRLNIVASTSLLGSSAANMDTYRSSCISYASSYPISAPHYDFYDFANKVDATLKGYVDTMVVASFGGSSYSGFTEGVNGLGFFFSDGNEVNTTEGYSVYTNARWNYQWWYTGVDVSTWWPGHLYGKLDFCTANGNGSVESWYELLQSIYNPYDQDSQTTFYSNYHPGFY